MTKIKALWFLPLLWLLVHIVLVAVFGHRAFHDAGVYLKEADFVLTTGTLADADHIFYLTLISILSFFRWLFPDEILPFIIFQCLVSGVAVLFLFKASVKIFNSRLAAFLSGVIFLLWWDNIHWNITLMTESLACSLMCFMIYVLANFQGRAKDFLFLFALLLLSFFTRPTGIIPIVGSVIFLMTYYRQTFSGIHGLNLFLIVAFCLLGVVAADQMFLRWDFTEQYEQGNIVTYMNRIEGTSLYEPRLRLETTELIIPDSEERPLIKMVGFMYHNPIHFLHAGIHKLYFLVSGTRPYYSIAHNAFAFIWAMVVYLFFFFGWKQLTQPALRYFVLAIILFNCGLVFISTVDWDNRFYIPMEPVIVLMAGKGAAFIGEKYKDFFPFKRVFDN